MRPHHRLLLAAFCFPVATLGPAPSRLRLQTIAVRVIRLCSLLGTRVPWDEKPHVWSATSSSTGLNGVNVDCALTITTTLLSHIAVASYEDPCCLWLHLFMLPPQYFLLFQRSSLPRRPQCPLSYPHQAQHLQHKHSQQLMVKSKVEDHENIHWMKMRIRVQDPSQCQRTAQEREQDTSVTAVGNISPLPIRYKLGSTVVSRSRPHIEDNGMLLYSLDTMQQGICQALPGLPHSEVNCANLKTQKVKDLEGKVKSTTRPGMLSSLLQYPEEEWQVQKVLGNRLIWKDHDGNEVLGIDPAGTLLTSLVRLLCQVQADSLLPSEPSGRVYCPKFCRLPVIEPLLDFLIHAYAIPYPSFSI